MHPDQIDVTVELRFADTDSTRQNLESEAQAARTLFGNTPFPSPEPVALGEPGFGYPLP